MSRPRQAARIVRCGARRGDGVSISISGGRGYRAGTASSTSCIACPVAVLNVAVFVSGNEALGVGCDAHANASHALLFVVVSVAI